MKILLLNQCFWPDVAATAQQLTTVARGLRSRGHEVTVIAGRRGYAATPYLHECISDSAAVMLKDKPISAIYLPNGVPLKPGERVVQAEYAETLAYIAQHGPDALYNGLLGNVLVDYMKANATASVPLGGALWQGGAETFVHKGTHGRWRDVLTVAETAKYEHLALQELQIALQRMESEPPLPSERAAAARSFAALFTPGSRIAMITHVNADGDGLGSEVGLWHLLMAQRCQPRRLRHRTRE